VRTIKCAILLSVCDFSSRKRTKFDDESIGRRDNVFAAKVHRPSSKLRTQVESTIDELIRGEGPARGRVASE
jgi:hypothetical protein